MTDQTAAVDTPKKVLLVLDAYSNGAWARSVCEALKAAAIEEYVVVPAEEMVGPIAWDDEEDLSGLVSRLASDLRVSAMVLNVPLGMPMRHAFRGLRAERKELFVMCVTNDNSATESELYARGLGLLKLNSLNLVVTTNWSEPRGFIIAPEETRYSPTSDMPELFAFAAKMLVARMRNHFTRSTVVPGDAVRWDSEAVPANLRDVVDHCITYGAYKPVLGKTAGHFAVRAGNGEILTSIRKSDFNKLDQVGLVRVTPEGDDRVVAHGFRPSVGGQSQRIIFREHPDLDCIVHFHCPVKEDAPLAQAIPVRPQWQNECGSHECGRNTSEGLSTVDLGDGHALSVVFLDDHGPNIVFNRNTPAMKVCNFIDANFDLRAKTGGLDALAAH